MDNRAFADTLVKTLPDRQVTNLLQAVSDAYELGSCPLCGEESYPVDAQGAVITGQNVEHAAEWREEHDADCMVTFIEGLRNAGITTMDKDGGKQ
jgi:hypothetical protein